MSGDAVLTDTGNWICDRSDLPVEMCGHCRTPTEWKQSFATEKRARERVRTGPLLGRWFRAGYPGKCSRCQTPYAAGEDIRADYPEGSGYIRRECHEGARARKGAAA